jgi:alpha-L-fucosidase
MATSDIEPAAKAAAIRDLLAGRLSVDDVCAELGVGAPEVQRWRTLFLAPPLQALADDRRLGPGGRADGVRDAIAARGEVSCPACGQTYAITPEYHGAVVECPACQCEFTVRSPGEALHSETPARAEHAPAPLPRGERLHWWRQTGLALLLPWGPDGAAAELRAFAAPRFDARDWAGAAHRAGARLLIVDARLRNGLLMYHSLGSRLHIAERTAFGRDAVRELFAACREAGIRFGVRYSLAPVRGSQRGPAPAHLVATHLVNTVRRELGELLGADDSADLVWFTDLPEMTPPQADALQSLVRQLAPRCIIAAAPGDALHADVRIADGRDGLTLDSAIRVAGCRSDGTWTPAAVLAGMVAHAAAAGSCVVIEVAPTDAGVLPYAAVRRLRALGDWMAANCEAVHEVAGSPFSQVFPWGSATACRDRLYLLVHRWPRQPLMLRGLPNRVRCARVLGADMAVATSERHDERHGLHEVELTLPVRKPGRYVCIVALTLDSPAAPLAGVQQVADNSVVLLPAQAAVKRPARGRCLQVDAAGVTANWSNRQSWLTWDVCIHAAGGFTAAVEVPRGSRNRRHRLWLETEGATIMATLRPDRDGMAVLGTVTLAAGWHQLRLRAAEIKRGGIEIAGMALLPRS